MIEQVLGYVEQKPPIYLHRKHIVFFPEKIRTRFSVFGKILLGPKNLISCPWTMEGVIESQME